MGSRAHGLALARPLALDAVSLAAGEGNQARPRAGHRLRARRGSGRGRRARRHSRPDAADRQPQRDRQDGQGHHARRRPSARACRRLRALPARRDRDARRISGARSPRCARRSRNCPRPARTATWCRSSIRRRRPSPIPAASNSSSRKAPASITAGRAETWRTDYVARVARHRAEIRAETDRLGWSFTIHRTDRPASELLLALHARMARRRRARRSSGPHRGRARSA